VTRAHHIAWHLQISRRRAVGERVRDELSWRKSRYRGMPRLCGDNDNRAISPIKKSQTRTTRTTPALPLPHENSIQRGVHMAPRTLFAARERCAGASTLRAYRAHRTHLAKGTKSATAAYLPKHFIYSDVIYRETVIQHRGRWRTCALDIGSLKW